MMFRNEVLALFNLYIFIMFTIVECIHISNLIEKLKQTSD